MRTARSAVSLFVLLAVTACTDSSGTPAAPAGTPTSSAASASVQAVPPLGDGPVTPGRYRFRVTSTCDPKMGCPAEKEPPLPTIDITVPQGWDAATKLLSLFPAAGRDSRSRNDPALVLGWTNFWVGLNSQPCSDVSHQKPDIAVGPTADDFVDAVATHPRLDVTDPKPVTLGRYRGQFLSLIGPKDISDCGEEWRPWDPGPYLQGEENRWDLWVMDVDGVRVVILAQYFPETPRDVKTDLRAMAESIRFTAGTG